MPFDFQPAPEDDPESLRRALLGLALMALVGLCGVIIIVLLIV